MKNKKQHGSPNFQRFANELVACVCECEGGERKSNKIDERNGERIQGMLNC